MATALSAGERIDFAIGDDEVTGFGVRFAPLEPGDAWRLRVSNRAYGHQTYAPSGSFSVGGARHVLRSGGEDLVEFRPADAPDTLRITVGPWDATLTTDEAPPVADDACAPGWARGLWIGGSWAGLTQERVEADLVEWTSRGLHARGRLVDHGWYGNDGELFEPSAEFPDLPALVRRHLEVGLDVALWVAPWVPIGTAQWERFRSRGWFVTDTDGDPAVFPVVGDGAIAGSYLDLSADDVARAWSDGIRRLADLGVRAIKLDFGEALPDGAVLRSERTVVDQPRQATRNEFPLFMQDATRTGLRPGSFVMSRAGWTDSPSLVSVWIGDQSSDRSRFAGLGSTPFALRSSLDAGYRQVGFDVGGYFGTPSPADFCSWQRTSLLFDFALYHGLTDRSPWSYGDDAVATHNEMIRLRGLVTWSTDDRVDIGRDTRRRAICQRTGRTAIAVADLGEPMAVSLPDGVWHDVVTGREHHGDAVFPCAGGSLFLRA